MTVPQTYILRMQGQRAHSPQGGTQYTPKTHEVL